MNPTRDDFLNVVLEPSQLANWTYLLPSGCRIIDVSLFADIFIADREGSIHMLELAAASISQIAGSEAEFRSRCREDEDGWLLRNLASQCRTAGKSLNEGQCYAFTITPLFGGKYEESNIWVCPWDEWLGVTTSIFEQTRDLPDGSRVYIDVTD